MNTTSDMQGVAGPEQAADKGGRPRFTFVRDHLESILTSGSRDNRRPTLDDRNESSVRGLYVIGDLAGAPVIKLAMAQGYDVIDHISALPELKERPMGDTLDVLIVGAGASGLNAALRAQERGLKYVLIEKSKIANTIENFPEGKWVYAEPDAVPPKGKLWLDGSTKETLIDRWNDIVQENRLDVRTEEALTALSTKDDGVFVATTTKGRYRTRKVVLATGQRGNPKMLGVPGEDREEVYHRLYSPRKYKDEHILVIGGGNSAIEAALVLSEQNKVVLSYRSEAFTRIFKDNRKKLGEAIEKGRIEVIFRSEVQSFRQGEAVLKVKGKADRLVPMDHAFVLVGADLPVKFLKGLGIRLENEWEGSSLPALGLVVLLFLGLWFLAPSMGGNGPCDIEGTGIIGGLAAALGLGGLLIRGFKKNDRWAWLGVSFVVWYSVYGIKFGKGEELWPYKGWGYSTLSFFDRSWAFWYTVLYTTLMTVFGLKALKRWGIDRKDKLQIWRYASLIGFQWVFFFIVPEFLFHWAVEYQWVGQALSVDPQFADQAWRSYGIVYAWPLFFYTFFYDPHQIWVVWGVVLTFLVIPIFVLFNGKRYCSWICGCGGLAETFGDRWRHFAPKGKGAIKLESMGTVILAVAVVVTLLMLFRDTTGLIQTADWGVYGYRLFVDVWLVGILPVTVYPFMGGKVWCRYWCPLAKLMQFQSKFFTKFGLSKFHIVSNDKCIGCNECSRNCQVGIDVMQYALKQETLDNSNSSCIGCGICVSVCPMDTLSYSKTGKITLPVVL
jgi:NosR/NirI family transcriptional regulator, nitrous oxide reductase regulator